jgi:hypothetical protein
LHQGSASGERKKQNKKKPAYHLQEEVAWKNLLFFSQQMIANVSFFFSSSFFSRRCLVQGEFIKKATMYQLTWEKRKTRFSFLSCWVKYNEIPSG